MPVAEIKCPHCQLPTTWADNENRPFCSERCRMIDLGAWFESSYRITDAPLLPIGEHEENSN